MITVQIFTDEDEDKLQLIRIAEDMFMSLYELNDLYEAINNGRISDVDKILTEISAILEESKFFTIP